MNLRRFSALLAVALFATATAADAKVHRVHPGESIQEAIDAASSGDTILVEPGEYRETGNTLYGLRIGTDNLRLIGKVKQGQGEAGKVRLIQYGTQETGVYAAPSAPGCEYTNQDGDCPDTLHGFYIRGFSVEDFPVNGIQTRWVDGFRFLRNESVRNLNNGIYPTLSANGLVAKNISYGSLDTAMWVAGGRNVRVFGNEVFDSVIGLEITVANNVLVTHNDIHDNTVGVGLFHPNAAGNPPQDEMANWVLAHNHIYDNNAPNNAPDGSFQQGLFPGYGVLMLGVSDHVVSKNKIEGNDSAGIAVLGWCTATGLGDPSRNCTNDPPVTDPSSNDNLISQNKLSNNGGSPPPEVPLPGVDILYFQFEQASGNCFEKNKPSDFTFFSSEPDGELPTDGC